MQEALLRGAKPWWNCVNAGECDLQDFTKLIKQHYTGKELQKFYKEGFPNLVGGGMSLTDKALKLVRSKDPKCARFTKEFFEDSKNFAK